MRLTATAYLTLDGVHQGPGGAEEGFDHGGWQAPYIDEDLGRLATAWFANADAFLFGRRTYEIFAAHWPHVTDPADAIAAGLNARPKYVVSSTLREPSWAGTTIVAGADLPTAVARLKAEPGNELQVHGSGRLIGALLEHRLIDELRLLVYPVILGSGRRLFPDGIAATALTLVGSEPTTSGAIAAIYEPAGRPEYGSAALVEDDGVVRDAFRARS